MGNASKKPKPAPRAPGGASSAKPAPPRFAVVRTEPDEIKIVNVEHVTIARFTVLPSGSPLLYLETIADGFAACFEKRGGIFDPESFSGSAALDLAAHLILCGVDVEGAADALARARGDVYADYFKREPRELPEPDEDNEAPGPCAGCAFQHDETCAGWIPGGLDDACGAFEPAPPAPPSPPITVAEFRDELSQIRAAGEIHAREVAADLALGEVGAAAGLAAIANEETRASCSFGEACKRFPACGDCSLYALDRACEALHNGDRPEGDDRRVVHVEHVEQVSGETSAALLARVERCGVFVGLKGRGVVPGDQWCGVGHEMTDPACALCPYLRIYAPVTEFRSR
jgi:hypothetical protein